MMDAYNVMLKQLERGNVDEHFIESANLVYARVFKEGESARKQTALELQNALCQRLKEKIGLVFPVYSYILRIDATPQYIENFLKIIRSIQKGGQLGWQKAYYLFQQLNRFRLQHRECDTEHAREMLGELLQHAVTNCMLQLNVKKYPVPYKERQAERVIVLTGEFSKKDAEWMGCVLECCYQLQCRLGKKVVLVNTAEAASRAGELSYFAPEYGEEDDDLCQQSAMEWKGEEIEYFQCSELLKDAESISDAVQMLLEYHPGMALHLGDSSFLAGILDQWLPVLTMGKTYGAAVVSGTEFQVLYESRLEMIQEFSDVVADHQRNIQKEGNLRARLVFPAWYFAAEDRSVKYYESDSSGECVERENFYIEKMMKRAWAVSIKIVKEIEKICKKHHIQYFADWGTLLGAVRHQGFVPWDDDIDIAMRRQDYNRFLAIAREELPEGYCIVDATYDEKWTNLIARVLNVPDWNNSKLQLDTDKLEQFYGCPYIVGIDIQPLDYIPRNSEEADLQADILQNVFAAAYELLQNGGEITEEIKKELNLIEEVCNYHFTEESILVHQLFRLASAISQMYGEEDGDEITYMYSYVKRRSYRLRAEWYKESVTAPFETTTVEVPKEYVKVLEALYGEGWKSCYKGASAHEYPFYKSQRKQLENAGISVD